MSEQNETVEGVESEGAGEGGAASEQNGAAKPLSELAVRAFGVLPLGYPVSEEWASTVDIQNVLNGEEGAGFLAVQVVEDALTELFNVGKLELIGGETKKWRESSDEIAARLGDLLDKLTVGSVKPEDLSSGVGSVRADDDVGLLVDAGLVEIKDDAIHLVVDEDGRTAAMLALADEVVRSHRHGDVTATAVQESIAEVAAWREKAAAEKRRGDSLASWIARKGFSEQDALDEVRGVTVVAKPKREEFDWTASRIVDSAEKGVIFGEVLALENAIAAVRLEADEAAGEHKSRIKGLEAQIRDLKNAAACNMRTVSVRSYKRMDWDAKKVIIHAADDHRVLAEEELPRGTQREIETEPTLDAAIAKLEDHVVAKLDTASDEAVTEFGQKMKALGYNVTLDLTKSGAERVVVTGRSASGKRIYIPTMEMLEMVVIAHLATTWGTTTEQLVARLAEGSYDIELKTDSAGIWPPENAIEAALLRLRNAGRVTGPADGWREVVVAEERLRLPTDEAELTDAVFATTDGELGGLTFEGVVAVLEERFEVPAGTGKKIELALDRLVTRGALDVIADGVWCRPEKTAPADAEEPGPLASPEVVAAHAARKGKRAKKPKPAESRAER